MGPGPIRFDCSPHLVPTAVFNSVLLRRLELRDDIELLLRGQLRERYGDRELLTP